VDLIDVSLRDGNQSLWGATGLTTAHILEIAPLLNRVGFRGCDFTSSTHMGVAVRTHQENPWERIRLTHQAMPDTKLQFIGTGLRFISWETLHQDFLELVYERLVANGIERFMVMDSTHDWDAVAETAMRTRRAGGAEIVGGLIYTISPVHDDAFYAAFASRMAADDNFDRVYIKDPSGLLTPERARTLIPAVQAVLGDKPLELHSHATIGLSPLTYMVAAELGVAALHTGCGPLGNGSSLPNCERTVANLREHGHETPVDERLLRQVASYFSRVAAADGLPVGTPREYDASFLRHQVAGGVMTTTRRQLRELGHEDRFDAVIEEVSIVRAELGYPIMVTPFPQMVCSQALFNVLGERYENVSDQVIRYALGKFGKPTAPIDPDVLDKILSRPRAKQIESEAEPLPPDELRRRFASGIDDEEFLLRAVMPPEQVDAMVAAGPAPRRRTPEVAPIAKLLRGLREQDFEQLEVEQPDFKLTVRA
jgi:oxaloacetate decarboxylase alpha subunit